MPASGRSEAEVARSPREGVGRPEGDRREPDGRARRGWGGVRCCAVRGRDSKGQARGGLRRRKHRNEGANEVSDRVRSVVRESEALSSSRKSPIFGRQRASGRLPAGASAVFVVDRSLIYRPIVQPSG
ncbi:hypothetical protein EXE42_14215 [Halorubrum sp. SP3]|nr:hypothetical protein EXE42_14215 [Halorubrum sp. SP3]TKX67561.1 hypothetical protein EXE45_13805 [Halorubrum sp. SP9]